MPLQITRVLACSEGARSLIRPQQLDVGRLQVEARCASVRTLPFADQLNENVDDPAAPLLWRGYAEFVFVVSVHMLYVHFAPEQAFLCEARIDRAALLV